MDLTRDCLRMEAYVVLIIQGKFRWHVANRGCDWREAHTSWLVSHSPIVTSDLARQGQVTSLLLSTRSEAGTCAG